MALDVGELRATLSLDREDFDRDLDQAQTQFRQLGQTAERSGQQAAGSFSGVGQGVRRETDQAEQSVRRLGQSGEQAGQRLGAGIQSGASTGMRGIAGAAGQAGSQAGAAAGAGAETGMAARLSRLGAAGGPVGMAIMAVAAVGLTVGKALADNIMQGLEKQALANRDKVKFGWTESQAKTVGAAAGASYVSGWGESIGANRAAAGQAIQVGLVGADATEADMKNLLDKLGVLGEMTEEESKETISQLGQLVKTGLVKDWQEGADLIVAAQQAGVNQLGDMGDLIKENGALWKALGIDAATGLDIANRMVKGGLENFDQVSEIFEELGESATKGSEGTTQALADLGLSAETLPGILAKGGQAAEDATLKIFRGLQQIQDPIKRNEIGTELFGSQWVKLQGIISGIDFTGVENGLGGVAGKAQEAQDALGGPAAEMESAKRSIEKSLGDVQVKLADAFGPSLAQAAQWVSEHTEEISRAFEIAGGTIGMVAAAIGAIGGTIVGVVGEIIEHGGKLMRGMVSPLLGAMESVGQMMAKMPGQVGEMGRSLVSGAQLGRSYLDTWVGAGEAMSDFGWNVLSASNSVGLASAGIALGAEKAKTATDAFAGLGIKVREVPSEKRIVIEDNSPEARAKIEALGIKVETLPDGSIYIDADDKDAADKIRELIKTETKTIVVKTTTDAVSKELADVNKIRTANGMAPLTPEEFGTGSAGAGINGSGTGSTGEKIRVEVDGKPVTKPGPIAKPTKPTAPATQVQKTTAEKEADQKAADKVSKAEAAEKKKTEAAEKKASDAAAKIPGLQSALAIAEQRVRELKPNASASSRMSAEQSVTKAREALTAAQEAAKGAPAATATTTGADGKPLTVTGAGKGGQVVVGTDGKPIQVEPSNGATGDGMRVFVTNMPAGGVGGGVKLSLFANGGIGGAEDHTAQIARGGDMRIWAEPETGGEAYIPLGSDKRVRSMAIARQVAAHFGQRLVPFDDGGITPNPGVTGGNVALGDISADGITTQGQQDAWDAIRQAFPSISLTSATRIAQTEGHADFHNAGQAIDISGSDADELAAAEWIAQNYPNSRELIHSEGFAHNIKDGKDVGDGIAFYGADQMAAHANHVHWTPPSGFTFGGGAAQVVGADGKAVPLGAVGLTADSSREDVAKAIIGEGRKRGYSDDDIRKILATAVGESDLKMQDSKDGPWNGIFQQDASYAGRNDPNTNIKGFFDELDKGGKDYTIEQRIVGVQQHHDANSLSVSAGDADYAEKTITNRQADADALFDKLSGSVPMGTTGAGTPTGTNPNATTTSGLGSGGVVDVRVTNWPSNLGGGSGVKLSLFANGGIEDHTAHITDRLRVFGEPETGGEAYIPLASSKRARSIAIWQQTGRRLGVEHYAGGGISVPKIEAPKIAPSFGVMPGGPIPIGGAPAAATATPTLDPLAGFTGAGQSAVPGTGDTATPQQYAIQRTMQLGGDLAKIGIEALKGILLPSGLDSQQAQNVLGLVKGVGSGIKSSSEKADSTRTTKTNDGKTTNITNNHTWNVSSADEAFRNLKRDEGRKALTYDGSLP